MAVSLKHTTQAAGTDAGNGEIRKAQWNEEHTLSLATGKLLGRSTAGTGAAEEITPGTGLTLSAGSLAVSTIPVANGGTGATTTTGSGGSNVLSDNPVFAGNVGIAVSNPAFALQVALLSTTDKQSIGVTEQNYLTSFRATYLSLYGTSATGTTYGIASANLGVLQFQNTSGGLIGTNGGAPLIFATVSLERMRIDNYGNMGIGQIPNASQGKLQINQSLGSTIDGAIRLTDNVTTSFIFNNVSSGLSAIWSSGALAFGTNSNTFTERMRIDTSGFLGVGTSSPDQLLSVNSANTGVNSLVSYKQGGTTYGYTGLGTDNKMRIQGAASALVIETTTAQPITFNINGSEKARIDASGNVGIGNTSPVTPLHVTGASMTTGVVYNAQPAQTSKAAATTLTIAELLTGIIQYTGAVATLTLPTGTSIEGGLPATFPTDMSFDVSFINTGAALLTIGANGNTTVGTMTVATATSAMLRFRKTATNTYTVYRLS